MLVVPFMMANGSMTKLQIKDKLFILTKINMKALF